jgi:hypothetical protein
MMEPERKFHRQKVLQMYGHLVLWEFLVRWEVMLSVILFVMGGMYDMVIIVYEIQSGNLMIQEVLRLLLLLNMENIRLNCEEREVMEELKQEKEDIRKEPLPCLKEKPCICI